MEKNNLWIRGFCPMICESVFGPTWWLSFSSWLGRPSWNLLWEGRWLDLVICGCSWFFFCCCKFHLTSSGASHKGLCWLVFCPDEGTLICFPPHYSRTSVVCSTWPVDPIFASLHTTAEHQWFVAPGQWTEYLHLCDSATLVEIFYSGWKISDRITTILYFFW